MSHLLKVFLVVCFFSFRLQADCPVPQLPGKFQIREHVISFPYNTAFDLKTDKSVLGSIKEKILSLTKSFRYEDASGNLVAEASSRLFSWGVHIDVSDCQRVRVGSVKENILKSFWKIHTTYAILDASGRQVAVSEKVEWISTDVTLRDNRGQLVAKLHRPWINLLSDKWDVDLLNAQAVDSRLLVMIAAYKTSVDNDRRVEKERKERRRDRDDD